MNLSSKFWPQQFPYPQWYLDAVSGSTAWDYVLVKGGDGEPRGLLPFQIRNRSGIRYLGAPPMSPRLGPYIYWQEQQHEWQKLRFLQDTLRQLDEALPKAHYYKVAWPYDLTYGLPWQQIGWQQRTRYSYVLPLEPTVDELFSAFRPTLRNRIRKAKTHLTIESTNDWQVVDRLMGLVFRHRAVRNQLSTEMLGRLYEAAQLHKAVKLWVAKDAQQRPHAALWLHYDATCAYNLLPASDPTLRHSGAVALLLWHAIQWSKAEGLTHFDFEGSHLPGVEPFFRSFGAEAWPYYEFVKGKKWLLALNQLR